MSDIQVADKLLLLVCHGALLKALTVHDSVSAGTLGIVYSWDIIVVSEVAERPALQDQIIFHLKNIEGNFAGEPFGDGEVGDCAGKSDVSVGSILLSVDDQCAETNAK